MPEGDTIHRIARSMGRALEGRPVLRVTLRDQGSVDELAGRTVSSVSARGKHLLVGFDGGWTLRTHLGMHGRWRRLAPERPPPRTPLVLLEAPAGLFVCDRAYRAELVRTRDLDRHPRLARLGPDLLREPPDLERAVARALLPGHAGREIGDLLLDQRVAAGIGNVYKSEVLFLEGIAPRRRVGKLGPDVLRRLFARSAELMRANLETRRRETVPLRRRPHPGSLRLWVYGREGKPCLECGTAVQRIIQGEMARPTWFCSRCQS